jgi:hypothetical protein
VEPEQIVELGGDADAAREERRGRLSPELILGNDMVGLVDEAAQFADLIGRLGRRLSAGPLMDGDRIGFGRSRHRRGGRVDGRGRLRLQRHRCRRAKRQRRQDDQNGSPRIGDPEHHVLLGDARLTAGRRAPRWFDARRPSQPPRSG